MWTLKETTRETVSNAGTPSVEAPVNHGKTQIGQQFFLEVTALGNVVGDTLDVTIQVDINNNANNPKWVDLIAFVQVQGNHAVPATGYAKVSPTVLLTTIDNVALAAGSLRHITGYRHRVKWTIVGTGFFTFSVWAQNVV